MACVASLQQKRCASESRRLKFSLVKMRIGLLVVGSVAGGAAQHERPHFHLA
jgi:hypothetical protein